MNANLPESYVAIIDKAEVLDADADLDTLLARLVAEWSPDETEDVAIWHGLRVVAIVRGTGGKPRVISTARPDGISKWHRVPGCRSNGDATNVA
jgi:hypothetical protein